LPARVVSSIAFLGGCVAVRVMQAPQELGKAKKATRRAGVP
jgi:hypothetical protein